MFHIFIDETPKHTKIKIVSEVHTKKSRNDITNCSSYNLCESSLEINLFRNQSEKNLFDTKMTI